MNSRMIFYYFYHFQFSGQNAGGGWRDEEAESWQVEGKKESSAQKWKKGKKLFLSNC